MNQEIILLDVVALLEDIPEEGLTRGEMGTVVEVFAGDPNAFLVEFSDDLGNGYSFVTLFAHQLLRLHHRKASIEDRIELLGKDA